MNADEFLSATCEKNLFAFLGDWRKIQLEPYHYDPLDWEQICSLDKLIIECRKGNVEMQRIAGRMHLEWDSGP